MIYRTIPVGEFNFQYVGERFPMDENLFRQTMQRYFDNAAAHREKAIARGLEERDYVNEGIQSFKFKRLSPTQIAWCIERGIFKRDMLADKVAS